jgi:hypothetical protein
MEDMAGLVLVIHVSPKPGSAPAAEAAAVHKIDLVIEPTAEAGKAPTGPRGEENCRLAGQDDGAADRSNPRRTD